MSDLLPDEACHIPVASEPVCKTLAQLIEEDHTGDVMLHNTMRFDVQLAHIQPMLDDGDVDKRKLIEAIEEAILDAVEAQTGISKAGALVIDVKRSRMLHRELISVDLS